MTVGDVIAAICLYASEEWDTIMRVSIYSIEVQDDCVEIDCIDGNTGTITIPRKDV